MVQIQIHQHVHRPVVRTQQGKLRRGGDMQCRCGYISRAIWTIYVVVVGQLIKAVDGFTR